MFSYDKFKDDWSYLGVNPYLNHLPENLVRYYCSVLRLFNFLNSRPFYFALLISVVKKNHLKLTKQMVAHLGEEFVLTANIKELKMKQRVMLLLILGILPSGQ